MAKSIRRIFTMILAICICTCMIAPQALAAEITTETTTEGGITTTVTTTTDTVVDGDTTTETVIVETDKTGTDAEGFDVVYNEEVKDEVVTTEDETGTTVTETSVTDGSEIKEKEVPAPETDLPKVEVAVIPGEEVTGTATDSDTVVEGDVPVDENDKNYDYTETTTTTNREVTVETSDTKITVNESGTGFVGDTASGLHGVLPEYDENDDYTLRSDGKISDSTGKDGLFDRNYLSVTQKYANPDNWDMPDGAEFRYIGTGEHSKYFVGFINVVYEKDEDGNTLYDEDGNPIIEALLDSGGNPITIDGVPATELVTHTEYDGYSGSRAQNFMLMDKNGNRVIGYCCDIGTGANVGYWYSVQNLEDSDYYASEESENHIRNIVLNGYWGTSDIPDEDGNYKFGSLENIKANIIAAVESGELDPNVPIYKYATDVKGQYVLDENGNPVVERTVNILEILDGMTEGEAMLATQAAIWSYSNGKTDVLNGKDGNIIVNPDWYRNHQTDYSKHEKEPLDAEGGARVNFLYNWLIGLDNDQDSTVVINDKNFVEDTTLVVGDKVGEVEVTDEDGNVVSNGIYDTSISFALGFTPGEKDNLLMQLKYLDIDNNEVVVVKRIAGENAEGEDYETLEADENGKYTFGGLKLAENRDFSFDMRLEGTQYLENGVYVYQALGGRTESQSFVGVAQGERNVDVSMGVTVSFDVTEETTVTEERYWHSEADPEVEFTPAPPEVPDTPDNPDDNPVVPPAPPVTPPQQPTPPAPPAPTAPVYIPDDAVPQAVMEVDGEVIIDEEVPLADVPATGDNSALWLLLSAAVIIGLVLVNLSNKKRTEA